MHRRKFLATAAGTIGGAAAMRWGATRGALAAPKSARRPRQPNILYIFTDQQSARAMSCAGNPNVKTPAIDSLAERGMVFAEAHCASPVCSPSRASMLTGLHPHQHGVIVNNLPIRADCREVCIERLLGARGYDCVYAGKWHLPGSSMTEADRKRHPYRLLSRMSDDRVSAACARYFGEARDRPFFLVASYLNPHDICLWAMGREGGYQAPPVPTAPAEQCPSLPANYDVPEDEPDVLRSFYMARHCEHASFHPAKWRQYLHAYYRMIEAVDADIGRLLAALRSAGLERDTLIVFSSDHGDGMAAHQWLGKCCHYDEALRVPLIVCPPEMAQPGRKDPTRLVSSGPDFYATALDYAGAAIPAASHGRSLRPLLEDPAATADWRDQVVSEIWVPGNSPRRGEAWKSAWGRSLRTPRFKYTLYDRGRHREQLHDVQNDRADMHNLAADPRYGDQLAQHRRRLAAWCEQTKDESFLPHLVPS